MGRGRNNLRLAEGHEWGASGVSSPPRPPPLSSIDPSQTLVRVGRGEGESGRGKEEEGEREMPGGTMGSYVLSECGLRPLPSRHLPLPGCRLSPNPCRVLPVPAPLGAQRVRPCRAVFFGPRSARDWRLKVSAPVRTAPVEEGEEGRPGGIKEVEGEFDPGMPPPFGLAEIRAAIPKHCWVKNPWRSMSYVVRDVAIVLGLAATAAYFNSWIVWPLYWAAQGTMFWALFVLGHDWYASNFFDYTPARCLARCSLLVLIMPISVFFLAVDNFHVDSGHGSFSNDAKLNSVAGHFLHSSILVPYHGW